MLSRLPPGALIRHAFWPRQSSQAVPRSKEAHALPVARLGVNHWLAGKKIIELSRDGNGPSHFCVIMEQRRHTAVYSSEKIFIEAECRSMSSHLKIEVSQKLKVIQQRKIPLAREGRDLSNIKKIWHAATRSRHKPQRVESSFLLWSQEHFGRNPTLERLTKSPQ